MRIISLAPSQTEVLAALGCVDSMVGRSDDCDYPPGVGKLSSFGPWAAPDLLRLRRAKPDLVCTFGEHQEEVAAYLRDMDIRVHHADPRTVVEAVEGMKTLASLVNRVPQGKILCGSLETRLELVRESCQKHFTVKKARVFRIMHWRPLMTVGPGAFQDDVITLAGGHNIFHDGPAPYFVCRPEDVVERSPDVIFFCDPVYVPRLMRCRSWNTVPALAQRRIYLFDCGLTCRAGPRIVDMVEGLHRVLLSWARSEAGWPG